MAPTSGTQPAADKGQPVTVAGAVGGPLLKQVRFHAVILTAQGKHDNSGNLLKGRRRVAPHRARSGPACSWLDQRLPLQASLIGSRLMATCGLRVNRSVSEVFVDLAVSGFASMYPVCG